MNYYNEWDEEAAALLRELIRVGLIPPGEVDTRSIEDVRADDLAGFNQCHFFAGIGGWPLAFRLTGIPDDANVWSASVPCPPYSVASNGHGGPKGQADSRHLWPSTYRLIKQLAPAMVYGEQVASAVGWGWLDEVALDLEDEGYAFASAVLRADAYGAIHERRRILWAADASRAGLEGPERVRRVPLAAQSALSIYGKPLALARFLVDGGHGDLQPCDGLSLKLARSALKGYGNAIVPQVAQAFIEAVMEEA